MTFVVAMIGFGSAADAVAAPSCLSAAKDLLRDRDPSGARVVEQLRDPMVFERFLVCSLPGYNVGGAIHESVHMLDFERSTPGSQAFVLAEGEVLTAPRRRRFPRSEILTYIPRADRDLYVGDYLTDPEGSTQGLESLLLELNAYTQGAATDARIAGKFPPGFSLASRDGIVTFLIYVELYVRRAREAHPEQWLQMTRDPALLESMQRLWSRAEAVLSRSAGDVRLGHNDRDLLRICYATENISEMERLYAGAALSFASRAPPRGNAATGGAMRRDPAARGGTGIAPAGTRATSHPATLRDLEALLEQHPELRDDAGFMGVLREMRKRQAPADR